jgi:hypothetical protein
VLFSSLAVCSQNILGCSERIVAAARGAGLSPRCTSVKDRSADHLDFAAPALRADQPLPPIEHGRFGAVPEQPSRRDRARPNAGSLCAKRSTGRGQQQRCRVSSAGQARISFTKLIPLYYYIPFIQQFHNNILVGMINKFISLVSIVINAR